MIDASVAEGSTKLEPAPPLAPIPASAAPPPPPPDSPPPPPPPLWQGSRAHTAEAQTASLCGDTRPQLPGVPPDALPPGPPPPIPNAPAPPAGALPRLPPQPFMLSSIPSPPPPPPPAMNRRESVGTSSIGLRQRAQIGCAATAVLAPATPTAIRAHTAHLDVQRLARRHRQRRGDRRTEPTAGLDARGSLRSRRGDADAGITGWDHEGRLAHRHKSLSSQTRSRRSRDSRDNKHAHHT